MADPISYSTFNLPSQGAFYNGKLPNGSVEIRKLTIREEATLASNGMSVTDRIKAIIRACTKFPEGFDPEDLLLTDRMAVLLALRTYTFGADYRFKWRCPACNAPNASTVNVVHDLDEKTPAAGAVEPIEVVLPDAKVTVGVRFLRGRDEVAIIKQSKKLALQNTVDPSDPSHIYRLAMQIVTIDNRPVTLQEAEIVVGNFTMADSAAMRNAIEDAETGIDTELPVTCRSCATETELPLPFDAEFFRPTRLR